MRLVSVNVGCERDLEWQGRRVRTSIFKSAVNGPADVRALGLAGDEQSDRTAHGGVDKAVYGYPIEHYPWWKHALGDADWAWGALGENLSTSGLLETELCIGDRLRVGAAELVVTQPRTPCYKLGIRLGHDDAPERFRASGRCGFYFSVAREGTIAAGDPIEVLARDPLGVTVADVMAVYVDPLADPERERRVLEHPRLAARLRGRLRERRDARTATA
jgi:MOSC domain-containing protein YiiM